MMALKSGGDIVFPRGLKLHKVQKCTEPQGDTGVVCYVSPDVQKCSCCQGFCDVPTCETFILNLVYGNICTWQPYALLYGCVREKGRKGLWSLLCI